MTAGEIAFSFQANPNLISESEEEEETAKSNVWEQNFDADVVTNVTITENFEEDDFAKPSKPETSTNKEDSEALPTRKQIQKKIKTG